MGSGVGGMLRSTNKKLSPMITPQIHLVHDAIRAMLWDVEFYFQETSSRGQTARMKERVGANKVQ